MVGLGACDSSISSDNFSSSTKTATNGSNKKPVVLKKGPIKGLTAKNRFNIDVKINGSLVPKNTVTIKVIVRSLLPSTNAQVQVVLPAIAALNQGSTRLTRGPLPVQLSKNISLGKGQISTQKTTVSFDKPGYYQVIAAASNKNSGELTSGGEWIKNSGSKDIWLWINKNGGKVTDEYDSTLISKKYRNQPGPLRKKSDLPANQMHKGSLNTLSSDETTIAVDYINQTFPMSAEPLAGARMSYDVYDAIGKVQNSATVVLNEDGEATIPCYEDFRGPGSYSAAIHTQDNYRLSVYHYGSDVVSSFSGNFAPDCGQIVPIQAAYKLSHVFETMIQAIENSRSFFQEQRGKVQVNVTPNVDNSKYNGSSDLIYIMDKDEDHTHVGGNFGDFTVAHEYGHALQEKGLGGIAASGQCPSPHFIDGGYNLQCAYTEGFADYHATVSGFPYSNFESTDYSKKCTERDEEDHCINHASTSDGSIIEGGVASFLYDLTDPANEDQDDVQYSGHYVAEIIKTCDVYHSSYGWIRANGVDHLIACFDQRVPNYDFNEFNTRSIAPTNYREQATEPSDWDDYDIKRAWEKDLYDENIAGPPPATLSVTISGPFVLNSGETGTWAADVTHNEGSISYQWYIRHTDENTWYAWGNSTTVSNYFQNFSQFNKQAGVKVTVSSAGETATTSRDIRIIPDCANNLSEKNDPPQTNRPPPCN